MELTEKELALARTTYAKGSTEDEWELFLADCRRLGISPLDKKLHFQIRKQKIAGRNGQQDTWERRYAPVTSIDYMREVADRTGKYAGSDDAVIVPGAEGQYPVSATVAIYKMVEGLRCGFVATAQWDEFYPGDGANGAMWRKMPTLMIGKCAEALALRKGFPGQLAGLYEKAEMDQAEREDKKPTLQRPAAEVALTLGPSSFKELAALHGWATGDLDLFLKKHYQTTTAKATALSPDTFNQIIADVKRGPNAQLFQERA